LEWENKPIVTDMTTEELDVIDAELDEMNDNTFAVSYEKGSIPKKTKVNLEWNNVFTLDDFEGETVHFFTERPMIRKKVDNDDWCTYHPDGKEYLKGIKRKLKNMQRKQRRAGGIL
jgi:hypothetical protein